VKAEYWRLLQTILAAIFPFMCEVSVIFAGRIAHRDQQVAMIAEGSGGRTFGRDRGGDRRGVHTAGRNCDAATEGVVTRVSTTLRRHVGHVTSIATPLA
jgi:hypothetical protein